MSVRSKNARVKQMLLNIRIRWNAGTACVSESVLKTLACRGLRVGPSKLLTHYHCQQVRRPHSSYQKVVQGKCPLHFLNLNGVVCSNTLFSNTSALTSSLLFRGNSTCKILEHLVLSNTSGFQFWRPLARTHFLSALCGPPNKETGGPLESAKMRVAGQRTYQELERLGSVERT